MKLTDRDTKIINFINECGGATIEQIQKLFFPSYDMSANRLKILVDNKFLKVKIHPILGKKVYYTKKMPSFHSLCITDIMIQLKDEIKFMQREYKIKNNYVDCIFVLNSGKIIILEVDIYNRTKESKIKSVLEALEQTGATVEVWIVGKGKRREKIKNVKYIEL
ncbi:hypothetical protein [Caloramator proteoclasticus]|uniref:Uncharacterized protein n=1 Tax=Caloramator proteoclasticus DSM 10124 TaxID=1121262 RepID=A0A1M4ZDF9_9CLOT|nr:hypothetical protein [Caloramator proteoclasticus]SHF15837.1 hypothetical protein SAMN02746091_01880 [Caloramator proteoclasticus DSM 10124]